MKRMSFKCFSGSKLSQIKKKLWIFGVLVILGFSSLSYAVPLFTTDNLDSNRYNGLANNTFQVVMFYDGSLSNNPRLEIEFYNSSINDYYYVTLSNIHKFTTKVETRQYYLDGYQPTGVVRVLGTVSDGGIDGLAFGFFWKDSSGNYYVAKSRNYPPFTTNSGANFVGAWPIGYTSTWFETALPQVTDSFGREQARMAIYGAQLLRDGTYDIL